MKLDIKYTPELPPRKRFRLGHVYYSPEFESFYLCCDAKIMRGAGTKVMSIEKTLVNIKTGMLYSAQPVDEIEGQMIDVTNDYMFTDIPVGE